MVSGDVLIHFAYNNVYINVAKKKRKEQADICRTFFAINISTSTVIEVHVALHLEYSFVNFPTTRCTLAMLDHLSFQLFISL